MVADKTFLMDGTNKIFGSDYPIKGLNYCRVFIDSDGSGSWKVINDTEYIIVNDSVVFNIAPTGSYLVIQVATTPTELSESPTDNSIILSMKDEIKTVAGINGEIVIVSDNVSDINKVAGNESNINKVSAIDSEVVTVAGMDNDVTKVASMEAKVNTVVNLESSITDVTVDPLRQAILDGKTNADKATSEATQSELEAWKSEAERMTADSYATEPEDVFVKLFTSNGDGTFTSSDTSEYSALHWATKANDSVSGDSTIMLSASTTQVSGTNEVSNTTISNGFSTFLHTGNGSTQNVANGIDFVTASSNVTVLPLWVAGTYNTGDEVTIVREGRTIRVVCLQDGVTSNPNDLYGFVDAVFNDWQIDSQTNGGLAWVKSRNNSIGHSIYDTLRGATKQIISNVSDSENTEINGLLSFNNSGFIVGNDSIVNANLFTYVSWSYQTTHIKSSLTSHGKPQIEEYNPITGFTMIKHKGSGLVGNKVSHSLGKKLAMSYQKNLSSVTRWIVKTDKMLANEYLVLNDSNDTLTDYPTSYYDDDEVISLTSIGEDNATDALYVIYGWANAEETDGNVQGNFEIGTYVGTGAVGNKITTKGKPLYLLRKRMDATGNWLINDNQRSTLEDDLYLNLSNVEGNGNNDVVFNENGFIINGTGSDANTSGGQYLYMVVYDNDNGSGKSKYDAPSATSNLNITDGGFVYTSGKNNRGYVLDNNTFTGSVDSVGQDGLKWIAKDKDADTFQFFDTKPVFTIGDNLSWIKNPVMFASGIPQYVDYSQELSEIVQGSTTFTDTVVFKGDVDTSGALILNNLDTVDPMVAGVVWSNAGILTLSQGV